MGSSWKVGGLVRLVLCWLLVCALFWNGGLLFLDKNKQVSAYEHFRAMCDLPALVQYRASVTAVSFCPKIIGLHFRKVLRRQHLANNFSSQHSPTTRHSAGIPRFVKYCILPIPWIPASVQQAFYRLISTSYKMSVVNQHLLGSSSL